MKIRKLVKENEERLLNYRHHLHLNPELGGKEYGTLKFIMEELDKYNIPYVKIEDGGLLATLDSGKPGKSVVLRGDIDALPLEESGTNPGKIKKKIISNNKGVAHMCGHDAHTSMLLVALEILSQHKDEFKGKIYGFFEQGEETGNKYIFNCLRYFKKNDIKFDTCFGIHVDSDERIEPGTIILHDDSFYAGMFDFKVKIFGKGGHGSRPDLCHNPIDCFSDFYMELTDTIKSTPGKLTYSICHIECGHANNVISDLLTFEGSSRFYSKEDLNNFINTYKIILSKKAEKHQCTFEVKDVIEAYPLINNHEAYTIAKKAFDEAGLKIIEGEAKMGSESFPYLMENCEGLFINLLISNPKKGITAQIHNSQFDIDEDQLYKGSMAHICFALEFLNNDNDLHSKTLDLDKIFAECGECLE